VRKEYFDEMANNYGTIEKYFSEGLGINVKQQQALKDLYRWPGISRKADAR